MEAAGSSKMMVIIYIILIFTAVSSSGMGIYSSTLQVQPHTWFITQVSMAMNMCITILGVSYKATLKPIWTYTIQLWGTASTSNVETLDRFQSKVLCTTVDTPWYVSNMVIRRDLQTPTVKEEIHHYSSQYNAHLSVQPNDLVVNLMVQPDNR
jgi:hypothetical protein